jgi:hypothetical protein
MIQFRGKALIHNSHWQTVKPMALSDQFPQWQVNRTGDNIPKDHFVIQFSDDSRKTRVAKEQNMESARTLANAGVSFAYVANSEKTFNGARGADVSHVDELLTRVSDNMPVTFRAPKAPTPESGNKLDIVI